MMLLTVFLLAQQIEFPATITVGPGTTTIRISITIDQPKAAETKPAVAVSDCGGDPGVRPVAATMPSAAVRQGEKYCDALGTEVLRLSGDNESVQVLGTLGFNANNSRFATINSGGGVRVYDIDPVALAVRGSQDTPLSWSSWWSPDPDILLSVRDMVVIGYSIASKRSWIVADLSAISNTHTLGRASGYGNTFFASVMDGQYRRVGYVVATVRGLAAGSGATVRAKFLNSVDSPSIGDYQTVQGLTLTSPYEPGMDSRGGYKGGIAEGGERAYFATWDARGDSAKYNTVAILDLSTGKWSFAQGSGHASAGRESLWGINTAFGSCPTAIKRWAYASLTSSPSINQNQGDCVTPQLGWTFHRHYVATAAGRAVVALTCAADGCAGPYLGELWEVTGTGRRIAKLWASKEGYQEVQPVLSADGKFVAFTNNISGTKAVYIARMPQ